jgi:tRNA threonylcarbamoyladenosine biosynthesis protein TsaE
VIDDESRDKIEPAPAAADLAAASSAGEEKHVSHDVAETESIAARLAATLRPGDVIALHGDLGAGKTQFVRGLLIGLGGDGRAVSSPTFVLLNVYAGGRLALYHLDAYRVAGAEDFSAIGFEELLEQGGVVAVEWPSRVAELLPARRIDVYLESDGQTTRSIRIARTGS